MSSYPNTDDCTTVLPTLFDHVVSFHSSMGEIPVEQGDYSGLLNQALCDLRVRLIEEELDELKDGLRKRDPVEVADALADLAYVVLGSADRFGIPFNEVFAEVHRSNMSKVCEDGTVLRRSDGKIIKPDTYEPPCIEKIIEQHRLL